MSALFPAIPELLHGGDYNPDQWLDRPDILEDDIRMMKKAGINTATLGVFAWSTYEPEEGNIDITWLKDTMDRLYENGIYTVLATPTGARPAWMDEKYPEVMRVAPDGKRNRHGNRHNHCMSSPAFRKQVEKIDTFLAKEAGNHPGLILWHISNELGGACYCDSCRNKFIEYLRNKYHNDINELNRQWWTSFWSHTYNCFEQIEPPYNNGEHSIMGLNLDWKRFNSLNMKDYMCFERDILKKYTPNVPVTTNFMKLYEPLDYVQFSKELDIISWDAYPAWNNDYESVCSTAKEMGFDHAVMRSLKKDKPFMLMESTPSLVNWHKVNKLKRPGVLRCSSIQTIASGSDTCQYFQWRKGRGAAEQFHGAVVDHLGTDDTRVFREVSEVGDILKKLKPVAGSRVKARAAVVFDWSNRWAVSDMQGMSSDSKKYEKEVFKHYQCCLNNGVDADIVFPMEDISSYDFVTVPMLYAMSEETAKWLADYAAGGGVLSATYLTGYVNENTLAYLGGFPGAGLRKVFGLYAEELDSLYPSEANGLRLNNGAVYQIKDYCEIIRTETAEVIGCYENDFYRGQPAFTVNNYEKGKAFYIAARTDEKSLSELFRIMWQEAGITPQLIPSDVIRNERVAEDGTRFLFFVNYGNTEEVVHFDGRGKDLLTGNMYNNMAVVQPMNAVVIEIKK